VNDGLALTLQLAMPRPFDLGSLDLAEYGELSPAWRDWETVVGQCQMIAGSSHRRQLAPRGMRRIIEPTATSPP